MRKLLSVIVSLLVCVILSCSPPTEPESGGHTIKLANYFNFNEIEYQTSLNLILDGHLVISSVPYGQTKSYGGVGSGSHTYQITYSGEGWAEWGQASISLTGANRTFLITVTSSGEVTHWIE